MAPPHRGTKTRKAGRGVTPLRDLDIFHTPIYVINLKERKDRMQSFMQENEAAQELQIRRMEAQNGKLLNYLTDKRIAPYTRLNIMRNDRRTHREIATLGAIGASISHASVWQKLVDSGAPYAVVMEDDARFTAAHLRAINDAAKKIPASAAIWLFGAFRPNMAHEPIGTASASASLWSRVYSFTAMHAYVITREAAKKLLQQVYPIDMHIDHYMSAMSVLYDIPMLIHRDVHVPYAGILKVGSKTTAVESNTSQHTKDGCSACHVPDQLHKFYRRVGPKTARGRVVRGLVRKKIDRSVRTLRNSAGRRRGGEEKFSMI